MDKGVERASARTGEFARLAAAIDEAEWVAGERIGGPSEDDISAVRSLESRLCEIRPVTGTDWWWYSGRLARALENGWSAAAVNPLLRLAE
jgi:hypothetical protein